MGADGNDGTKMKDERVGMRLILRCREFFEGE